jgi:hypothetical protein
MTTNHTPGPWNTDDTKSFYVFAAEQSGVTHGPFVANASTAANARLIAAAPDLLAALRQCLVIVDAHRRAAGGEGDIAAMNARAAIARATL